MYSRSGAGNGGAIRREGNAPAFRILAVAGDGDLILQNTIVSGWDSPRGGGVYVAGSGLGNGVLTLANGHRRRNRRYLSAS